MVQMTCLHRSGYDIYIYLKRHNPISETGISPGHSFEKTHFCYLETSERKQNTVACIYLTLDDGSCRLCRPSLSQA